MLNGIGGNTIQQAKHNLSHVEAVAWGRYIQKRGSLSIAKRIDRGFALLCTQLRVINGLPAKMEDFLPYIDKPEDVNGGPEDVLKLLQAIARK